jgi:hypothetical protein
MDVAPDGLGKRAALYYVRKKYWTASPGLGITIFVSGKKRPGFLVGDASHSKPATLLVMSNPQHNALRKREKVKCPGRFLRA